VDSGPLLYFSIKCYKDISQEECKNLILPFVEEIVNESSYRMQVNLLESKLPELSNLEGIEYINELEGPFCNFEPLPGNDSIILSTKKINSPESIFEVHNNFPNSIRQFLN
jgi:hypothetical protein